MFNWGTNYSIDTMRMPPEMPAVKPPKQDITPDYSVGTNDIGGAVFVLYGDLTTMTLSLSAKCTKKLIKLLEATLDDNEEEEDA